jgi:hypothetical protein
MTTPNHDSDTICGNCGTPRSHHFHDPCGLNNRYCNQITDGDVFTSEPSDATLVAWIRDVNPSVLQSFVIHWKRHHGHGV